MATFELLWREWLDIETCGLAFHITKFSRGKMSPNVKYIYYSKVTGNIAKRAAKNSSKLLLWGLRRMLKSHDSVTLLFDKTLLEHSPPQYRPFEKAWRFLAANVADCMNKTLQTFGFVTRKVFLFTFFLNFLAMCMRLAFVY